MSILRFLALYIRFLVLYIFNVVCNAGVAFAAFGYLPTTNDWIWDRAWRTFWSLFGGFWGALGAVIGLAVVMAVVLYASSSESKTTLQKWGLGFALAAVIIGVAILRDYMFSGNLAFLIVFAAIFAIETFAEQRIATHRALRS
jgi:hypothetical protein